MRNGPKRLPKEWSPPFFRGVSRTAPSAGTSGSSSATSPLGTCHPVPATPRCQPCQEAKAKGLRGVSRRHRLRRRFRPARPIRTCPQPPHPADPADSLPRPPRIGTAAGPTRFRDTRSKRRIRLAFVAHPRQRLVGVGVVVRVIRKGDWPCVCNTTSTLISAPLPQAGWWICAYFR